MRDFKWITIVRNRGKSHRKKVDVRSTLKQFVMIALVLVSQSIFVLAEETSDEKAVSVSCSIGVYDKYLSQWSGAVLDIRPSVQGDVCVSFLNGFSIDIWTAKQLESQKDEVNGNEVDLSFGWSGEIFGLQIESALTYYDLSPIADGREDNVWAPNVKVSKAYGESVSLSPFIRVEMDIPDRGSSFDGGAYVSAGVDTVINLTKTEALNFSSYFTYDNGNYGADENCIYGQAASLQYTVGDLTITLPSIVLTTPLQADVDRETEACFGASVGYQF